MIQTIPIKNFLKSSNGKEISLYILKNSNGITAQLTNYGATLVSLWTPDGNGQFDDIVLGYDSIDKYLETKNIYFGKTIGPYCNRIANGRFTIDGAEYHLEQNDGQHYLHGGSEGYHNVVWNVTEVTASSIEMQHTWLAGISNYPGTITTNITFTLTDDNALQIIYHAITDTPTHINLTNHTYFNLEGEGQGNILNHNLQIRASQFTPVDEHLIPTGTISEVISELDFRESKKIFEDLKEYDHNYVLDGEGLRPVARLIAPISGRTLDVHTTEPGLQLYTGQGIYDDFIGKSGNNYSAYTGLCLETQHFPDSPNNNHFPSTLVLPNNPYTSITKYVFGIV